MTVRIPASSAGIWGPEGCQANPAMQAAYGGEHEQSEKQREGEAAHYVVAQLLKGVSVIVGSVAENGVVITQDMLECSEDIRRDVLDTWKSRSPNAQFYVEYSFAAHVNIHPLNNGRADIVIIDETERQLFIWEYKYGHRFVDEYKNWQLINSAIGILETIGVAPNEWPQWAIVGTICQPRNYHPRGPVRECRIDGAELVSYAAGLKMAAEETQKEQPMMTTGEHCRDCEARHACAALQKVAMNYVDLSLEMTPQELPPEALGLQLKIIRDAMARLVSLANGLEAQAEAKLRSGVRVPYWTLDYSEGRERWKMPTAQVIALGDSMGVDLRKPDNVITPNQARKAGLNAELVKGFAERPRGAMALVPFSTDDAARRFT